MVWQRIEELRREEERRKAQEVANRAARERQETANARQQAANARQLAERQAAERRRLIQTTLQASGVTSVMREIARGLNGRVRRFALIENMDTGVVTLAWGNKFTVQDNKIDYERGFLSKGQMDYSFISASVNLRDQSIEIQKESYSSVNIPKSTWESNSTRIQDALADAYLHPRRVNERETPPSKYSSSSSGNNSECCNN